MDIEIQNYQIIEDLSLDLTQGITVISGETDQGKSALIRGVYACFYNQSGDSFIREGTDKAVVSVDNIQWEKTRNSGATYRIADEVFSTPGRGSFDEVLERGVQPLNAGGNEFELQFWQQIEPFLLLNRPSTRKFQILSNTFEADKFDDVLKEMNSDRRDLIDERKDVEVRLEQRGEDLEEKEEKLTHYEEFFADNQPLYTSIVELEDRYNNIEDVYHAFEEVIEEYDDVIERHESLKGAHSGLDSIRKAIDLDRFESVRYVYEDYCDVSDDLRWIEDVLDQTNMGKLEDWRDQIKEQLQRWKNLHTLYKKYRKCLQDLQEFQDEINRLEMEQDKVYAELEEVKGELGVCPTCERQWKKLEEDND